MRFCLIGLAALCVSLPAVAATGWVTPTGNVDGAGWVNGNLARDGSTSSYASHGPAAGWGGWETFSLGAQIQSDRFRVCTDFGYGEVDQIQVDMSPDNVTWTTVFVGAVTDGAWTTELFGVGMMTVQYGRFRYHRLTTNYTFWLYEFNFYQSPPAIVLPTVAATPATMIENTTAIPHGSLTDCGGEPCDVWFEWGPASGAPYANSTAHRAGVNTGDTFGKMITYALGGTIYYRAAASNSAGTRYSAERSFTFAPPGNGWWSPTIDADPFNTWNNEADAHEDETGSYASSYHNINDVNGQWSQYLYLNPTAAVQCNGVRFWAKQDVNIDSAQVDVYDGTTWTTVFAGAFADMTWVQQMFARQTVTQIRIRFHLTGNNVGMYWQLYELEFHRVVSVTVSGTRDNVNVPVTLLVNGVAVGTDNTVSGTYSITAWMGQGDGLLIYDDNNAADGDAAIATVATGANMPGENLTANTLIIRNDNAGTLANADLAAAKGANADTDIPYAYAGADVTLNNGISLVIVNGKTYAPGGNLTVPGNFTNNGAFTAGTWAVTLNGAAGTQTVGGTANTTFYDLTLSNAANRQFGNQATAKTFTVSNTLTWSAGNVTVGQAGVADQLNLTGAAANLTVPAGCNLTTAGTATVNIRGAAGPNGINVLAGATLTVAAGGSTTGPVSVANGATLSGVGTVGGVVTSAAGSTISPAGAGAQGTLTLSAVNPLSATSPTNLAIDINGAACDLLTGTAASGSVALGNIALTVTAVAPSSGSYVIMSYPSGTLTGTFASTTGVPAGYAVVYGANTVSLVTPDRYWVGGAGIFSDAGHVHWATSSGGAPGASSPGNTGVANFDASSGAGICTVDAGQSVKGLSVNAAGMTVTAANALTIGTTGITLAAGTLTLAAANTVGAGTTISGGTLNLNNATALGAGANTLTINGGTLDNTSGGAITLTNNPQTWGGDFTFTGTNNLNLGTGAVTLSANRQVTVGAGTLTVGGVISGAFGITKAGGGILTLTGANAFTGALTVNAGTLRTTGGAAIADTVAVTLANAAGAILDLNSVNETIGSLAGGGAAGGNVTIGTATLTAGGNNTSTAYAGAISGTGSLTKVGTGMLTLSGTNTFTGALTINAGTLRTAGGNAIADTVAVTLANAAGAILDLNGVNETIGSLAGGGAAGGNVTLGTATLTAGGTNASTTYAGAISGTGGLTKAGTGVMTLSGANAFTGTLSITAGTVRTVGGAAIADTAPVTLANAAGAILDLNNVNETIGSLAGGGAAGGNVTLGTATLTAGGNNTSTAYAGVISGTGGLTKVGTGMLTLSGTNTFTGALAINAGTLQTAGGTAIANTVPVTLANNAGAILDLNNVSTTIGSLAGGGAAGGNVTLANNATLTTGGDNTSTTYGGVISGTGSSGLTKLGTGTMTLTGVNTYAGTTTLTTGTLLVNGSTPAGNAMTMAAGTTLGGTGTVGMIANNGGTIQPGGAITSIFNATSANLSGAGVPKLGIRVNGFTTPGTDYDRLTTTGALNLGGASTLNVDLAGLATSGTATGIATFGSVTGTFTTVNLLNNALGYAYALQYQANSLNLILDRPVIIARQTEDSDHDGHLDRIRMVAASNLNGNFAGLTVTVAGYVVTGYTAGATADVFYVNLTELVAYDTGALPLVRITANANLRTAGTLTLIPLDGVGVAPTDKAPPVLVSATWTDGGTAGMVDAGDTVALTFSETVATTGMVFGDVGLPVTLDTLGGTAATAIPNQSAATISFSLPATPQLSPGGIYASANLGDGKPTGVFLAAATHVADLAANAAVTGNAASAVDLAPAAGFIRIEWSDGTVAAKVWALGSIDTGLVYTSGTYTIRNAGYSTVALGAVCSNSAAWTVQPAVGADQFTMQADASTPLDGTYELTLSAVSTALAAYLRSTGLKDFALQFSAPSSALNTTPQTVNVTITATQY